MSSAIRYAHYDILIPKMSRNLTLIRMPYLLELREKNSFGALRKAPDLFNLSFLRKGGILFQWACLSLPLQVSLTGVPPGGRIWRRLHWWMPGLQSPLQLSYCFWGFSLHCSSLLHLHGHHLLLYGDGFGQRKISVWLPYKSQKGPFENSKFVDRNMESFKFKSV